MNKWLYLLLCFTGLAHAEIDLHSGFEGVFGKVRAGFVSEDLMEGSQAVKPPSESPISPTNSRTHTELSPHLHNHFSSNNELLERHFPPSGEKCQIGILENRYGAKLVLIGTSGNTPPHIFDYGDYLAYRNQQGTYADDFTHLVQSVHKANRLQADCSQLQNWVLEHKIK